MQTETPLTEGEADQAESSRKSLHLPQRAGLSPVVVGGVGVTVRACETSGKDYDEKHCL